MVQTGSDLDMSSSAFSAPETSIRRCPVNSNRRNTERVAGVEHATGFGPRHVLAAHELHGRERAPELANLVRREHAFARLGLACLAQPRAGIELDHALVNGPVEHAVDEDDDVIGADRPRGLRDLISQFADVGALDVGKSSSGKVILEMELVDREVERRARQLWQRMALMPFVEEVGEGEGIGTPDGAFCVGVALFDLGPIPDLLGL